MKTISGKGIITQKRFTKINAKNLFSVFAIIFLSCVIIIASALITDLVVKMATGKAYSVVYREVIVEKEPQVLTVQL